jgi:uncharacterized damage-inducible protein DinB
MDMGFSETLLAEFENEMKTTRALLERVPMDKGGWKPHPKSTSLGALASHLATLAGFGDRIVSVTEIDFGPMAARRAPQPMNSLEELLGTFDSNVQKGRDAIGRINEDELQVPWTLRAGDVVIFKLPRSAVLRTMWLNHIIHHRGQLSVYLRLNDVPLPSIYGPTADT